MLSTFELTNITQDKQIPILKSVAEVIDEFQLNDLNHDFYHQNTFLQQDESLVITMTTYNQNAIKHILSTISQIIKCG